MGAPSPPMPPGFIVATAHCGRGTESCTLRILRMLLLVLTGRKGRVSGEVWGTAPTPPAAGATHPCTRGSVVRSTPCSSCGLAFLEGGERYEGRLLPVPLARGTGSAASPSFGATLECDRLEAEIYRSPLPLRRGDLSWPRPTAAVETKKPRRTEAFSLLRL